MRIRLPILPSHATDCVFRFSQTEGPAHFAEWLDVQSLPWQLIAVDEGDSVPSDPRAFAGIGMMGGPMSANDALAVDRAAVAAAARRRSAAMPVIGIASAASSWRRRLAPGRAHRVPEIGWIDVETTDAVAQQAWFGGRARFTPFQWHYDVFDLPARRDARAHQCVQPNQAYVIDDRHIGFQCHIEMTPTSSRLVPHGRRRNAAPATPARQSRDEILRDLPQRLDALQAVADGVYARWAQGLAR